MAVVICPKCGIIVPASKGVCMRCGAPLTPSATPGVEPVKPAPPVVEPIRGSMCPRVVKRVAHDAVYRSVILMLSGVGSLAQLFSFGLLVLCHWCF